MKKVLLKNQHNEVKITNLAIGENGIADEKKQDFIFGYMDEYIERGGNCLDTARLYGGGESEYVLGRYIKTRGREKVVISTKCAHPDRSMKNPPSRLTREEMTGDLETSLKALQTNYIDILFLHRDDISKPVEEIMPILDDFVKQGKVKVLGASNWTAGRIQEANKFAEKNGLTPFSVSQIHWSLALTTPAQSGDVTHVIMDNAEYSWYLENKFPVMAWSSSAKGFFSKLAAQGESATNLSRRYNWLKENYRRAERAKDLANELGVSVGSIVLAYLMCAPFPACAVTAFSNHTQFEEAITATEVSLTQEQRLFLEGGQ